MKTPVFSFLLRVFAVLIATLGFARAQTAVSPNHVTFYTEPNFKGDALVVEAGASVPNLDQMRRPNQQPWAFAISSVQITGSATASIYSGGGLSGQRLDLTTSVSDLYAVQRGNGATWDRAIAAVSVSGPPPPTTTVVTAPAPAPAPVIVQREPAPPPPTTVVIVPSQPPPPVAREVRPRYDRRTAEMIVERAYREVLDRRADPEGLRTYRDRLMFEGWTEQQIVQQLQRSGEARAVNPDAAITRIYVEVLGRGPDPNGLAHYRAKWREGWTQGQIRDDLRRSMEGRDNRVRDTIVRSYRELLGREPDAGGYATYERLMRERGYTERDVRAAIMAGDEYRQRHPRGR